MLERLTEQLGRLTPLSGEQVAEAVGHLIDERVTPEVKAAFLTALAHKGEAPEEILAFARELRDRALQPVLDAGTRARTLLDVCGTGGDRLHTFNISSTVALVAAAAGVTVAKHGNRAITSQAGSADVLEELGIRIDLEPDLAARWLREHRFAFLFAPRYHPAFRHIGPARKLCAAQGQRTIFNFLGPLLNPARPTAQLIGVPRPELCEPMARALQALGVHRGMVVCGRVEAGTAAQHLDEFSTLGETTIAEFHSDRAVVVSTLPADRFPVQPATLADLRGSDRAANAATVRRILEGAERGPKRDAVLLNTGAALFLAGQAQSVTEGWELAGGVIDSGAAQRKLEELVAASAL
jgi:anthranilate phosphoribosyltransferase